MLGILVWYDDRLKSGIVWCEDQGALAYLAGEVVAASGLDPGEGDLLEVSVSDGVEPRVVTAMYAVRQSGGGALLKELLRSGGQALETDPEIPLRPHLRVVA